MAGGQLSSDQLENRRKAFDFAESWAKLLVTLATGTLVLSATFIKDVLPEGKSIEARAVLFVAWALLGAAAVLGPFVQGALVSHLTAAQSHDLDIYAGSIRLLSLLQLATFFLGILLFALFVALNL